MGNLRRLLEISRLRCLGATPSKHRRRLRCRLEGPPRSLLLSDVRPMSQSDQLSPHCLSTTTPFRRLPVADLLTAVNSHHHWNRQSFPRFRHLEESERPLRPETPRSQRQQLRTRLSRPRCYQSGPCLPFQYVLMSPTCDLPCLPGCLADRLKHHEPRKLSKQHLPCRCVGFLHPRPSLYERSPRYQEIQLVVHQQTPLRTLPRLLYPSHLGPAQHRSTGLLLRVALRKNSSSR